MIADFDPGRRPAPGTLEVLHLPLAQPCRAGVLDPANGPYVLSLLERAADGCMSGEFAAMVTAPVHKGVINDAGIAFTGHTEFLAERTRASAGGDDAGRRRTARRAGKHSPGAQGRARRDHAGGAGARRCECCATLFRASMAFRCPIFSWQDSIRTAARAGHLGREEIEVIIPVLDRLRREGFRLTGPLPADTLFTRANLEGADCVLAMYHDQGLPVLKYASFGQGINVTLGLPIIRTSVDHGTALDLAGTGRADSRSLFAAVEAALEMVGSRAAHAAA